jgi:hypothetical protein
LLQWRGGWQCAGAANGEVRAALVNLWPMDVVQPRLCRDVVGGSRDPDDWVKSVLGSSSGRIPSESAEEGGMASRTRLKSSALANRTSQKANAEGAQERRERWGMATSTLR